MIRILGLGPFLLAPLLLALVAPQALAEIQTLEEALEAVKDHPVAQNQIPKAVGEEAADACAKASTRDLPALLQVAKLGQAEQRLAAVLMERFLDDPQREAYLAYHITKIDRAASTAAAREIPDWTATLLELTADVISPVPAFVHLLAWHGSGPQIQDLLLTWKEPDELAYPLLGFFLMRLRESTDPLGAFEAILAVELPQRVERYRFDTAKLLVRHNETVSAHVLNQLRKGATTPLLFRVLPGLPPKHLQSVKKFLVARLKKERGSTLAAAIDACTRLGQVEALPYAIEVAEDGERADRILALGCLPDLLAVAKRSELPEYDAHLEKAREAALAALAEDGDLCAAGIRVGMALEVEFVPDDILKWAQDRRLSDEVRVTALASLPQHVKGGVEIYTLLIDLLTDPVVAECAHRTLQSMTKTRLPRRPKLWRNWLQRYAANPDNPR